jgi:hypothetical protein
MYDIKPVISAGYTYIPEEYLDYCEVEGIEPTQEGFEEFIAPWIEDDFERIG